MIEDMLQPYFQAYSPWLLNEYYGQAVWVWLASPACFAAAYFLASLLVRLLGGVLYWALSTRHKRIYKCYISPLLAPLELWLGVVAFAGVSHLLPLTEPWRKGLGYINGTLVTFAVLWALLRLLTNAGNELRQKFVQAGKSSAAAIVPLMRKMFQALLIIIALVFLLQNWGFDVAALLAGLGIGGIAIALASQKTVENLFGGVSVTLDQPVRIGDFINFETGSGTVEDIGLRSVAIRTPARTRITIPNSRFSEMRLENLAARDKFQLLKIIRLRTDTTSGQLRAILSGLTDMCRRHEKTDDAGRARFTGFGDSGIEIELSAYALVSDSEQFMAVQEEVMLEALDIIHAAGAGLASRIILAGHS